MSPKCVGVEYVDKNDDVSSFYTYIVIISKKVVLRVLDLLEDINLLRILRNNILKK